MRLRACVRASGGHFKHTFWRQFVFSVLDELYVLNHAWCKECILKVWNVMFLFSLGSVSTLFRWGGNFCNICVKRFLMFTTMQKLQKIHQDFPELWSQMFCHLFYGSQCMYTYMHAVWSGRSLEARTTSCRPKWEIIMTPVQDVVSKQ